MNETEEKNDKSKRTEKKNKLMMLFHFSHSQWMQAKREREKKTLLKNALWLQI